MKLTKEQLKKIIKEEFEEGATSDDPNTSRQDNKMPWTEGLRKEKLKKGCGCQNCGCKRKK